MANTNAPAGPYDTAARNCDDPAMDAFAIVKSDTVNFTTAARGVYVGGAGDVAVVTPAGNAVTFSAVPAGTVLPVRCIRVNSTNTTATLMVGLV